MVFCSVEYGYHYALERVTEVITAGLTVTIMAEWSNANSRKLSARINEDDIPLQKQKSIRSVYLLGSDVQYVGSPVETLCILYDWIYL